MPPSRNDLESGGYGSLNDESYVSPAPAPVPTRSIYSMTRSEITKGLANRFVHSRTYIILYLAMAALSVTTVVLSLSDGCPGLAFYILEVIINTAMIGEVAVRLVAFGRQFWKSAFNLFDVVVTAFCSLTLLVIVFAGCGATSKEEEILDTLLLIARNVLQFGRLASVMRQSGQSIFSRPKPIDLSAARRAGYVYDIDISDDELDGESDELGQPLVRGEPALFDVGADSPSAPAPTPAAPGRRRSITVGEIPPNARVAQNRDHEDIW